MSQMISRTVVVLLSLTQAVSQDSMLSQQLDRRLQAQGYGAQSAQSDNYEQAPTSDYGAQASNVLPTTPYKVEVRLGCSCSLNIPCFDMKTKKCVPVICGFNGRVSFVDNRVPRMSHGGDDDYKTGNSYGKNADDKTEGRNLQYAPSRIGYSNKQEAGSYSNPVINGCKCPSGATRCYECAEIGNGAKIVQWILALLLLSFVACSARLTLSDPMPPTPINQDALGHVMLCVLILGLAALTAASTAADVGYWVRPWDLRRIYMIRWLDWLLSSLLMIYILTWVGGGESVRFRRPLLFALDAMMILFGFMATVVQGGIRWLFFGLAFVFYVWIAAILCRMHGASPGGLKVAKTLIFTVLKFVVLILWVAYPILWIMSPGMNHFCASSEATLYGLLDFLLKVRP